MTNKEVFEVVKNELNEIPKNQRSVVSWNNLRAGMKERFPADVIKMLDNSGFIVTWLGKSRRK